MRWASIWSTGPPTALGIDPIEMRRRNVMPDDGYPAISASGIKLKDLSHQRCIDALVERMNYAELREEQARLREKGIHRGIGIAAFIKGTAPGPHGYYGTGGAPISLQDACIIKLEPNGGVICAVGVTEQGQGTDTVMGQIAAARARRADGERAGDLRRHRCHALRRRHLSARARPPSAARRSTRRRATCARRSSSIAGVLLQADARRARHRRRHGGRSRRRRPSACRSPEIGRIGHFQLGELPNSVQPLLSHTRRFRLAR